MSNPYKDKSGHFTSEENSGGECVHTGKVYRQNTSYEELTNPSKNAKINLSTKEWAQFYVKLGEIERGGYVDVTTNGEKLIQIGNKLVISSGTYEEPSVERVFEFPNEEKLFDYLERKRGK